VILTNWLLKLGFLLDKLRYFYLLKIATWKKTQKEEKKKRSQQQPHQNYVEENIPQWTCITNAENFVEEIVGTCLGGWAANQAQIKYWEQRQSAIQHCPSLQQIWDTTVQHCPLLQTDLRQQQWTAEMKEMQEWVSKLGWAGGKVQNMILKKHSENTE
jgi:hypothetical protein